MKTVFTFIVLTFAVSAILYLGGVTSTNNFTAIGYIVNLAQSDLSTSSFWLMLFGGVGVGILAIITAAAAANTLTGGSSGVAITLGLAAFAVATVTLVGDFIAVIKSVGTNCVIANGGLCSIGYWIVWLYGILIVVGFVMALFDLVTGND